MLRLTNIRQSDGTAVPDIEVDDGSDSYSVQDMSDCCAVPGFFDSHIHGSFGYDVSDGRSGDIVRLARKLPSFGVSDFLPTLMTLDEDRILKAAEAVSEAQNVLWASDHAYAEISGIRLEGPFLNHLKAGVQNPECLVSADKFIIIVERIEKEFPGLIKLIDIAPELDGAMDIVSEYKGRYVMSLAHSDCDYGRTMEFFANGGSSLTHALNAMRDCLKRDPGPLGAAFDCPDSYIEVICDGFHIDKTVLRMLFKLFENRIIVVSDSMRAGGMPEGSYDLGGTVVKVAGGRTYFGPSGNLAGSVTNLAQEAYRLFSYGVPKEAIINSLVLAPRKRLRLDVTSIDTDNLNFVDEEMRLISVISRGRLVLPHIML